MHHLLEQSADMATALLAGEKLRELILPGTQDDKAGALAALLLPLKLELPFDRVVTMGTVLVPILLVTLVFTKNFAGERARARLRRCPQRGVTDWPSGQVRASNRNEEALRVPAGGRRPSRRPGSSACPPRPCVGGNGSSVQPEEGGEAGWSPL